MLTGLHRLRNREDVIRVIRHGRRLKSSHILFYIYRRSAEDAPRVACIVGKKVSKSAVRRHRFQRWLREIARSLLPTMSPKYDMVLMALPSLDQVQTLADLRDTLASDLPALRQRLGS